MKGVSTIVCVVVLEIIFIIVNTKTANSSSQVLVSTGTMRVSDKLSRRRFKIVKEIT
jgi:hypothetical protein